MSRMNGNKGRTQETEMLRLALERAISETEQRMADTGAQIGSVGARMFPSEKGPVASAWVSLKMRVNVSVTTQDFHDTVGLPTVSKFD